MKQERPGWAAKFLNKLLLVMLIYNQRIQLRESKQDSTEFLKSEPIV